MTGSTTRPPNQPPTSPPPSGPPPGGPNKGLTPPAPSHAGHQTPARRDQPTPGPIATTGGPARTTRVAARSECLTPGFVAAELAAVTRSDGAVVAPVAGDNFLLPPIPTVPSFDNGPSCVVISHGRGGNPPQVGDEVLVIPLGTPEPQDTWRFTVPRFAEGEHRLVGRVGPLDEAEAEAYTRLIVATQTSWPGPQISR